MYLALTLWKLPTIPFIGIEESAIRTPPQNRRHLGLAPRKNSLGNHEERLPQKRSTVDLDVLSGDEARPGTAEETHRCGDVGGFSAPADERAHQRVMLRLQLARRARRGHQAGRHRVHPDVVRRELVRQRARETDETGLGGHYVRPARG